MNTLGSNAFEKMCSFQDNCGFYKMPFWRLIRVYFCKTWIFMTHLHEPVKENISLNIRSFHDMKTYFDSFNLNFYIWKTLFSKVILSGCVLPYNRTQNLQKPSSASYFSHKMRTHCESGIKFSSYLFLKRFNVFRVDVDFGVFDMILIWRVWFQWDDSV